jgi:hypothetical protein
LEVMSDAASRKALVVVCMILLPFNVCIVVMIKLACSAILTWFQIVEYLCAISSITNNSSLKSQMFPQHILIPML